MELLHNNTFGQFVSVHIYERARPPNWLYWPIDVEFEVLCS